MRQWMFFGLAFTFCIFGSSITVAQESGVVNLSSYNARHDRLTEVETQLVSSGGNGGPCKSCYIEDTGWQSFRKGIYTGAELVIVKPFNEDGVETKNGTQKDPDFDYEVSPRIWVGYQNSNGFGARVRYWQWDHGTDVFDYDGDDKHQSLEVHVLDIERTQLVCWGPLEATFAGGVRWAKVVNTAIDWDDDGYSGMDFEGGGPTVALDLRRPFGCQNLAWITNSRGSVIFGDTNIAKTTPTPEPEPEISTLDSTSSHGWDTDRYRFDDDLILTVDFQTGLEYHRQLANCRTLSIRALMEGQFWGHGWEAPDNVSTANDDSGGFFGFTLSAVYNW